jgi:hypothetical protein
MEENPKALLSAEEPLVDNETQVVASDDKVNEESSKLIANEEKPETPLPREKVIPICIILFTEAFMGNSVFAYVGYMVLDFGLANDRQSVG